MIRQSARKVNIKEPSQKRDSPFPIVSQSGERHQRHRNERGGEQKRVSIGVELVADRELLCLDEPDDGLDPLTKMELIERLQELAKKVVRNLTDRLRRSIM